MKKKILEDFQSETIETIVFLMIEKLIDSLKFV